MEVNFAAQAVTFLWALVLGAALSLIYDFFRVWRAFTRPKPLAVFFQDIVFAFLSAILTYGFLLVFCKGELRAFVFLGELCGFLLCRYSLGHFIYAAAKKSAWRLRLFKRWIKRRIIRPLIGGIKAFFLLLMKILRNIYKNIKKISQRLKKGLKPKGHIVYNDSVNAENTAKKKRAVKNGKKKSKKK